VEKAHVFLDAIHAFRNPSEIYLVARHHLQKMTTFTLAEFNPRFYSRDLEGPRIHIQPALLRDYDPVRGEVQLGELTAASSSLPSA
jgi:hypothetical protein